MSDFRTLCKTSDIPEGEGRAFSLGKKVIGVYCSGGKHFAIDDVCPHMGASLSSGYVEDGIVTCPWHAWRFRLNDGAWADNPRIKIGCYEVQVVDDQVQVRVPEGQEKPK